MIRVGERGENEFKKVSWEEAFDFIAKKLVKYKKEHGLESVIMDIPGDAIDVELTKSSKSDKELKKS